MGSFQRKLAMDVYQNQYGTRQLFFGSPPPTDSENFLSPKWTKASQDPSGIATPQVEAVHHLPPQSAVHCCPLDALNPLLRGVPVSDAQQSATPNGVDNLASILESKFTLSS